MIYGCYLFICLLIYIFLYCLFKDAVAILN
jgi:hypothetical protein